MENSSLPNKIMSIKIGNSSNTYEIYFQQQPQHALGNFEVPS